MFRTVVNIPDSSIKIGFSDNILTLGSCFSENIGKKLQDAYFLSDINPFGVLYNPISVLQSIELLMNNKELSENDLFQNQSLWHSFTHSSLFSATTSEETVQNINRRLTAARYFFNEIKILIITLGTAWVYEDVENGKVVANCHKLPANRFNRRRLSVEGISENYTVLLTKIKSQYPDMEIIFTVSPIRHWKDGAHENNISKATLHLAVEQLLNKFSFVHYFPSYEIQLDELRDYRFYASDMLHPSEDAVNYIWQRFSDTYFSMETQEIKKQLEQLRTDLNHRPLHPESAEYQLFLNNIEKKKKGLLEKYSFLKNRF